MMAKQGGINEMRSKSNRSLQTSHMHGHSHSWLTMFQLKYSWHIYHQHASSENEFSRHQSFTWWFSNFEYVFGETTVLCIIVRAMNWHSRPCNDVPAVLFVVIRWLYRVKHQQCYSLAVSSEVPAVLFISSIVWITGSVIHWLYRVKHQQWYSLTIFCEVLAVLFVRYIVWSTGSVIHWLYCVKYRQCYSLAISCEVST